MEWDVSEFPDKPDGDLVSMKLRALTPDGIRMAIAKEYGLSNYREVMLTLSLLAWQQMQSGASIVCLQSGLQGCE